MVQAVDTVRAREFFWVLGKFQGIEGSGKRRAGAWLIRIGGREWMFWGFCQGLPCFGTYIPLGIVCFKVLGYISGFGGVWYDGGAFLV